MVRLGIGFRHNNQFIAWRIRNSATLAPCKLNTDNEVKKIVKHDLALYQKANDYELIFEGALGAGYMLMGN